MTTRKTQLYTCKATLIKGRCGDVFTVDNVFRKEKGGWVEWEGGRRVYIYFVAHTHTYTTNASLFE